MSHSETKEARPALRLKRRLMLADALATIVSFHAQMLLMPVPRYLAYKQLGLLLVALPAFAFDLRNCARTVGVVLTGRGAA